MGDAGGDHPGMRPLTGLGRPRAGLAAGESPFGRGSKGPSLAEGAPSPTSIAPRTLRLAKGTSGPPTGETARRGGRMRPGLMPCVDAAGSSSPGAPTMSSSSSTSSGREDVEEEDARGGCLAGEGSGEGFLWAGTAAAAGSTTGSRTGEEGARKGLLGEGSGECPRSAPAPPSCWAGKRLVGLPAALMGEASGEGNVAVAGGGDNVAGN